MQNVHDETVWGIMLICAGLLLLGRGIYFRWKNRHCTQIVTATCVATDGEVTRHGSHTGVIFYPVWRFRWNKKLYRVTDSYGSTFSALSVGKRAEILIDPDDPEQIARKGAGWGFLAAGILTVLAGAAWAMMPYII